MLDYKPVLLAQEVNKLKNEMKATIEDLLQLHYYLDDLVGEGGPFMQNIIEDRIVVLKGLIGKAQ